MSARELEISQAFDDGRESLALDILDWLDGVHDDDSLDPGDVRLLIENLLGWDPLEDD